MLVACSHVAKTIIYRGGMAYKIQNCTPLGGIYVGRLSAVFLMARYAGRMRAAGNNYQFSKWLDGKKSSGLKI